MVQLPSSFIRSFIGRTRKILSVVYNNEKWIYASETPACTIRECDIVRNVMHVTLTCLFIFWFSGVNNVKWIPRVCNSSLNYVEVNCVPASADIHSKSHQPNSSFLPCMDWNISRLSITASVVVFSIPRSYGILE